MAAAEPAAPVEEVPLIAVEETVAVAAVDEKEAAPAPAAEEVCLVVAVSRLLLLSLIRCLYFAERAACIGEPPDSTTTHGK